jgi:carbon-monoxide dehydrogenase small subunit
MTAVEILQANKLYSDEELRKLLSGHLCRCTGYENVFRAVKKTMYRRQGVPYETDGREADAPQT